MPGMMVISVTFVTKTSFKIILYLVLTHVLYFDEVEVCSSLGSKANKHKLGMFAHRYHFLYFSLNAS